jgi:UDP-glucuronate 4-epimerase
MPTYLVTGVAGFIASQAAKRLLEDGHTVVGLDNLNDAYDVRLKYWRLDQLKHYSNFTVHRLDICDRQALAELFNRQFRVHNLHFDAVINLAARAGVRQSVENPWIYFDTNLTGTLNLLDLCREFGVKKFVLASTSSLYGSHNIRPFGEDANTEETLSPYAASKKAAETLCYTYHYLYGIDTTIVRYFTVYGPAGRPDMSLFRFVQWICEGQPVLVYGDGTQERDFTYVDDIARGTLAALKPIGYEIINLGSDEPIVLNEAIDQIEELVGKKARREYIPQHAADVQATWADIHKAERLLGWRPQARFQEGLAQLIVWYHDNREWARHITTR